MDTLRNVIGTMQNIAIVTGVLIILVCLTSIAFNPDEKHKYITRLKNSVIAIVLVVLAFSLPDIATTYFGRNVEITDQASTSMTFAPIHDTDIEGREVLSIDGKWYVVTDVDISVNFAKTGILINPEAREGIDKLRLFSECQRWI